MIGLAFGALSALGTIGKFSSDLMGNAARRGQISDEIEATKMRKAQTLGLAAARTGASGVEFSSASVSSYLTSLGSQFDTEISRLKNLRRTTEIAGTIGAVSGLLGGGASTGLDIWKLNNP
jgi:hypothetical protein